ncbi:hypothetical protein W97_03826 [Coniosporium apollinis CBS 100218]|uniref:PHD-type domain-containing protein n=1 Tax=Coniosporium apollinis (strain CBS 100218) TaxID=1168221 RepID=R7YRY8_CONA1|nr:uncharacterized protein W97_03826 [Coniosporium apollinis CBS 100218]EON64593.1 hypothetical protein W97_03826 [Coniosporium apollinis CBS 100218]
MDNSAVASVSPQPAASTSAPQSQPPTNPPPNALSDYQNANPNTSNGFTSAASPFPQYSASTAEILKRVSANALGTQGWQAAREQVLKGMVTTESIATPPPAPTASKRGRGRSRGGSATAKTKAAVGGNGASSSAASSSPAVGRGRGGGRGRGRGGGRGGKRKKANSEEVSDDANDSDVSNSYTPLPSATRSGRAVNKPTQYVPTLPSPSADSAKKRRKTNRKPSEASLCTVCLRGTSPNNNMIVFCDACNTPYHQYCHDPPIPREVVQKVEAEWYCAACVRSREATAAAAVAQTVGGLVAGDSLTADEKRAYFSTLPPATLISLLVQASAAHPSLALFPPDLKSRLPMTSGADELPDAPSALPQEPSQPTANPIPTPAPSSAAPPPTNYTSVASLAPGVTAPASTSTTTQPQPPPPLDPALNTPSAAPTTTTNPTSAPAPAPDPSADAEADAEYEQEADHYSDDPPAHYPKPGNGLAATMRPEAEDLHWLVDDNSEVFQHLYRENDAQGVLHGGSDGAGVAGAGTSG